MSDVGKRILLIDDDPDMHVVIKAMLEPAGYELTCCSTGPAGVEEMRTNPPALLLLDIMLSTPMEGFHVAYEIRQDEQLQKIPIVMISAIGEYMGMDFAKELGTDYVQAEDFLEKPLEAQKLRAAVEKALKARATA